MKTFELYANGPSVDFNHVEDLKKNEIIKKRLFNEDGSVKNFYFYEEPMTERNPLNNRFRIGLFNDGKCASIETDTAEEMMSALELLNVKRKRQ